MKKIIIWILGIFLALFLIGKMCGDSEIDDKTSSYIMVREIVKNQMLKSPKSAEFQSAGEVNIVSLGDDKYQMKFWVDAQNSFGAQIRTNYDCTIQKQSGDKWKIVTIEEISN